MSSLRQISEELRTEMLRDYLSGMDTKEMMVKYGYKNRRNIYYRLMPLSKEDKLLHLKNKIKRMLDKERNS